MVLAAALVAPTMTPAAASTPTGSAYAAAVKATAGTGVSVNVTTTGLLQFLSPILSGLVNPLTTALLAAPNQLVSGVVGGLAGTGKQASSASTQVTRPASGYPTCTGSWTSSNCYGPATGSVPLSPLLSISTGTLQGYATGDATGFIGSAQTANPVLSLLSLNNLINLGVVQSTSSCTLAGTCSSTQSVTGLSALGGLVTASVASSDGLLKLTVAGVPLTAGNVNVPAGLPSGVTSLSVSLGSNLATLKIGISLTTLLAGLGLAGALSGSLTTTGTSVYLTLTIGPGSVTGSGSVQAWGLEVGVDLSATISLTLLGLAGVTVSVPTGISGTSYGNLLDLKLAYTNAYAGSALATGPQWIPPGVI
jgi:hypothetical protein